MLFRNENVSLFSLVALLPLQKAYTYKKTCIYDFLFQHIYNKSYTTCILGLYCWKIICCYMDRTLYYYYYCIAKAMLMLLLWLALHLLLHLPNTIPYYLLALLAPFLPGNGILLPCLYYILLIRFGSQDRRIKNGVLL